MRAHWLIGPAAAAGLFLTQLGGVAPSAAATVPRSVVHVKIENSPPAFVPHYVKVKALTKPCETGVVYNVSITNETSLSLAISDGGGPYSAIAPGSSKYECLDTAGHFTFFLEDSTSKLNVTTVKG